MTPAAEAFLAKHPTFTRDPLYGCWLWTGRLDKRDGYGVIWSHNKATAAYVAFYTALVGPPPKGLVLDHLCRNRECVRPAHLEPVTGAENDRRRSHAYRCRMAATKPCRNGHSRATCITTVNDGKLCRVCEGPEADPMRPTLAVTPEDMRASIDDGAAFMRMPRAGDEP